MVQIRFCTDEDRIQGGYLLMMQTVVRRLRGQIFELAERDLALLDESQIRYEILSGEESIGSIGRGTNGVNTAVTGSCLCDAIRYEVQSPAREVWHCHCWMCRKQHGAAFATYARYPPAGFRLVAGEEALRSYRSSSEVERQFCGICGSSLFWVITTERYRALWVAAGTLDGHPGRPADGHIYTGSKAPWHAIRDHLPQHASSPRAQP